MYQCNLDKAEPMLGAIGDIDELNAVLGVVLLHEKVHEDVIILKTIQRTLLALSSALYYGKPCITQRDIDMLKREIGGRCHSNLCRFMTFGSDDRSTYYNLARTVCRRAERSLCVVEKHNPRWVTDENKEYLNKLSSLLFAMSIRDIVAPQEISPT